MAWLFDELLAGIQRLSCLGLDRQPAAELIPATARTWLKAAATNRSWDQNRDTPRIRAAFTTLTQNRRTWPLPVDFFDALPHATAAHMALPRAVCTAERAHQHFDTIAADLATEPAWKREQRNAHGMSSMSDAARELAKELDQREGRA